MKLITCCFLITAASWLALRYHVGVNQETDPPPRGVVDQPARVDLEPEEGTVCLLPGGDPAKIPQLELAFASLEPDGRVEPLELEAIELTCESTGWACYYHVGSRALRLGVGDRQDLRRLVPGRTYTLLRAGYEPFAFRVPPVHQGECVRVEVQLVRES